MKSTIRPVKLLLLATLLTGCAADVKLLGVGQPLPEKPLAEEKSRAQFPTQTGLALSGGGSKSAPFEIGVLEGLRQSGVLKDVDILSSVSGGSYAALHYYSRLLAPDSASADPFLDCLPEHYGDDFHADSKPPHWSIAQPKGLCPKADESPDGFYFPIAGIPGDPLRQASHLRGFQDVFGKRFDYRPTTREGWEPFQRAFRLVVFNSVVLFPPSFVSNSLFDWRLDLSPSKERYGTGILRAYGTDAVDLSVPNAPIDRKSGEPHSTARLTFDGLRDLYESRLGGDDPIPMWVINATAGTSRVDYIGAENHRFTGEVHGFEFTPYGYGSLAYGWHRWRTRELEPKLEIPGAVGASAAFFDSQQRTYGGPILGGAINGALHALNLDWGTDLENYNLPRREFYRQRAIHGFLPWPFYLMHRRHETSSALYIHLSDGGQSENLGVAALLRRKVKDIIVVDAASDKDFEFRDVCELASQLDDLTNPAEAYTIDLDGFTDFSKTCEDAKKPWIGKNKLKAPILFGRVCKGEVASCSEKEAEARLYLIKPALNLDEPFPQVSLSALSRQARDQVLKYDSCNDDANGYPCEVATFWSRNAEYDFPQHSTVYMTFNSSPFLYGAYKELGRFYARQLEVSKTGGGRAYCVNARWRGRVSDTYLCPTP